MVTTKDTDWAMKKEVISSHSHLTSLRKEESMSVFPHVHPMGVSIFIDMFLPFSSITLNKFC
jgi:hypothetical protein